jgi:hypothetical protein
MEGQKINAYVRVKIDLPDVAREFLYAAGNMQRTTLILPAVGNSEMAPESVSDDDLEREAMRIASLNGLEERCQEIRACLESHRNISREAKRIAAGVIAAAEEMGIHSAQLDLSSDED